jgi:hypothetical protein
LFSLIFLSFFDNFYEKEKFRVFSQKFDFLPKMKMRNNEVEKNANYIKIKDNFPSLFFFHENWENTWSEIIVHYCSDLTEMEVKLLFGDLKTKSRYPKNKKNGSLNFTTHRFPSLLHQKPSTSNM